MELPEISIMNGITVILISAGIFIYFYLRKTYSYWERKGIPHVKASSYIFGHLDDILLTKKITLFKKYEEFYRLFKNEPFCGFYEFQNPVLMLRDPQMIQTVLVEKFNSFQNTRVTLDERADDILRYNPFVINGHSWKEARSIISSGLTPNKIRSLDDVIKLITHDMFQYIDNHSNEDIDLYNFSTRFTSEMVTNFGWGIRSNGFTSESTIKLMLDKIQFSSDTSFVIMFFIPLLSRILKLEFFPKELRVFLKHITKQSVDNIETNKNNQHTFLYNLMNTRDKLRTSDKGMSLQEMTGHLGTFYLDAYETTARFITYTLYNLMANPEVQQKLKKEILELESITVESVNKIEYFEMVVLETLRHSPLLPFLGRACSEKCQLGSVEIEPGTPVIVPIIAINKDPQYYPDPERFNPENFSEENINKRPKSTNFFFGYGPRTCVGIRYATTNIKLCVAYILKNYDLIPPKDHPAEEDTFSRHNPESLVLFIPADTLYLRFKRRSVS